MPPAWRTIGCRPDRLRSDRNSPSHPQEACRSAPVSAERLPGFASSLQKGHTSAAESQSFSSSFPPQAESIVFSEQLITSLAIKPASGTSKHNIYPHPIELKATLISV